MLKLKNLWKNNYYYGGLTGSGSDEIGLNER